MRLWRLAISIAILTLAFSFWHYGDWTAGPDNDQMDGTCRAIQELAAYSLALMLAIASVSPILLKRKHIAEWLDNSPTGDPHSPGEITRPGKYYDRLFD